MLFGTEGGEALCSVCIDGRELSLLGSCMTTLHKDSQQAKPKPPSKPWWFAIEGPVGLAAGGIVKFG